MKREEFWRNEMKHDALICFEEYNYFHTVDDNRNVTVKKILN